MKKFFTLATLGMAGIALASASPATRSAVAELQGLGEVFKSVDQIKNANLKPDFSSKKAQAPTKAGEWEILGTGIYRECILSSLFNNLDSQDIPVDMEKMELDNETVYKLVSPYANWENPFIDVSYDYTGDYDMYIHVENIDGTDYFWIEDFRLGIEVDGMGSATMITQLGGACYQLGSIEAVLEYYDYAFMDAFGIMEEGVLDYPPMMTDIDSGQQYINFLVGFSLDGDGYYPGISKKNPFTVVLPGYEIPEPVDPFDAYTYIGQGTFYNNIMTPILEEAPDAPYEVGVYCDEFNSNYFHIRGAWGDWSSTASADQDFEFYFPYINNGYLYECLTVPGQSTGYEDYLTGEVWVVSLSYTYTQLMGNDNITYDVFASQFPENCIYADRENGRIVFPNTCMLYQLEAYADQGLVFAPENYRFEGYLQMPEGYKFGGSDAGVNNVIDNSNAPVKYYNLQGVEIANPAKGQIVIKTQGNKATKYIAR